MKIAATISQYLLGIAFVIFGLNGFLHFIPMGPMPTGLGGQFMGAIFLSKYYVAIFLVQLISGLIFLSNRYIPLALTLIAPVIVNILVYHICMGPSAIGPGIVVTILWLIVFSRERSAFDGILAAHRAI